jgi:hypothetical protein
MVQKFIESRKTEELMTKMAELGYTAQSQKKVAVFIKE